jgi:protein-L-isoaspartate(D-aspartate) O-methyltransferase
MLRLLDVHSGHSVLDVGAGSGWTTALLAHLTGPTGVVVGVELVPELAEWGAANLADTRYAWASIRLATPEVLGVPEEAPYDRILVSADAPSLPQELVDQLGDGGRIVVPVRGTMTLGVRSGAELRTSTHGSYRFVPLLRWSTPGN